METETIRKFSFTRNEVIEMAVKAAGIDPESVDVESFNLDAAALAHPQPVMWLTVKERPF